MFLPPLWSVHSSSSSLCHPDSQSQHNTCTSSCKWCIWIISNILFTYFFQQPDLTILFFKYPSLTVPYSTPYKNYFTPTTELFNKSKLSYDIFRTNFTYWIIGVTAYTILILSRHIVSTSNQVYQWLEVHKNIRSNNWHSCMDTSNCINLCLNTVTNPADLHLYSLVLYTKNLFIVFKMYMFNQIYRSTKVWLIKGTALLILFRSIWDSVSSSYASTCVVWTYMQHLLSRLAHQVWVLGFPTGIICNPGFLCYYSVTCWAKIKTESAHLTCRCNFSASLCVRN